MRSGLTLPLFLLLSLSPSLLLASAPAPTSSPTPSPLTSSPTPSPVSAPTVFPPAPPLSPPSSRDEYWWIVGVICASVLLSVGALVWYFSRPRSTLERRTTTTVNATISSPSASSPRSSPRGGRGVSREDYFART